MIGVRASVLCLVLGMASQAAAESAWVLWGKYGGDSSDPSGWRVEDAFASRGACVAIIAKTRQNYDDHRLAIWRVIGLKDASEIQLSFRETPRSPWDHAICLPLPLDPGRAR